MFKIAGELTATVFHVAARSLATQALSIFGDHSDVMAARADRLRAAVVGFGAGGARHGADRAGRDAGTRRVPFLHFFDGFRTSHEVNTLTLLSDAQIRAMIDDDLVRAHRAARARPGASGRARHRAQPRHVLPGARDGQSVLRARSPASCSRRWTASPALTGRQYHLFDYDGPADAERVIVLMGSGAETARETAAALRAQRRKSRRAAGAALPPVRGRGLPRRAARDRARDRGAGADQGAGRSGRAAVSRRRDDARQAVARGERANMPRVIGGRYGLSSKDFSPALAKAVFDELTKPEPKNSFTVGINDDVVAYQPVGRSDVLASTRRTWCRRCSTALAPTARSARTRTA